MRRLRLSAVPVGVVDVGRFLLDLCCRHFACLQVKVDSSYPTYRLARANNHPFFFFSTVCACILVFSLGFNVQ